MPKKRIAIIVAVVILVIIGMWFISYKINSQNQQTDNSVPLPSFSEEIITKIGETAYGKTDITITPVQIIEDSRCPQGVQCVWAGRIVIKARIAEGDASEEYNFTEGEKVATDFGEIIMTKVAPIPVHNKPLKPEDYQMTFRVER